MKVGVLAQEQQAGAIKVKVKANGSSEGRRASFPAPAVVIPSKDRKWQAAEAKERDTVVGKQMRWRQKRKRSSGSDILRKPKSLGL